MASMLSLRDVLPKHERVDIGSGQEIGVFGVSGEDIGKILERFPNAFQQMVNSGNRPTGMDPALLGALVAASQREKDGVTSMIGDEHVEKHARSLSISTQMKIMKAIGRCTFQDGVGPFLEDLVSASSAAKEAMEVVVRLVSKDRATGSPPTPKPSEQPDIPQSGS